MIDDDIAPLRASIDAIDAKLIALLNERSGFVKQVGAIKKAQLKEGACYIRPKREAEMVRNMAEAFRGKSFPHAAAAHLWRMIISASLSLESPLAITAYTPASSTELCWLSREYFGPFTPVSSQPTARRVIGDVLEGKSSVGVLPLFDETQDGKWWLFLPEELKIFACVPFALNHGAKVKALAVARLEPEATGDDTTYITLATDMEISQSRLMMAFEKAKLQVISLQTESTSSQTRMHLVELAGFYDAQSEALAKFSQEIIQSFHKLAVLGAYANPIRL